MKKLHLGLTALGSCLVFLFFIALPVRAESVDERIQTLEQELAKLKSAQEGTKAEQMELRKEALAARDALPGFRYRPSRGLTISAADKSWAIGFAYRFYIHIFNHPDGDPIVDGEATGMHSGQLFPRRNRLHMTFCVADCFHEIEYAFTSEDSPVTSRDMEWMIHFEKLNPYLPTFRIGARIGGVQYIGRSSRTGFKVEHNILISNNDTTSTGSSNGIGLTWEEIPLYTGDVTFEYRYLSNGIGFTVDEARNTDKKSHSLGFQTRPFRETKIKWLRGLELNTGWQFQPIDKTESENLGTSPNRLRLRTHDRNGRLVLFDTEDDAAGIGGGLHYNSWVSGRWSVGPYFLRAAFFPKDHWADRDNADGTGGDNKGGVNGRSFEITNGLWLWSPDGFLTGRARSPGSVQLGFTFERADAKCGFSGASCNNEGGTEFNNNTLKNREVTLFYWVAPQLRVGIWWNWYESSNTPTNVQVATGCKGNLTAAAAGDNSGRECDWHTIGLGFQGNW